LVGAPTLLKLNGEVGFTATLSQHLFSDNVYIPPTDGEGVTDGVGVGVGETSCSQVIQSPYISLGVW